MTNDAVLSFVRPYSEIGSSTGTCCEPTRSVRPVRLPKPMFAVE
jgi:hypothetical protein